MKLRRGRRGTPLDVTATVVNCQIKMEVRTLTTSQLLLLDLSPNEQRVLGLLLLERTLENHPKDLLADPTFKRIALSLGFVT